MSQALGLSTVTENQEKEQQGLKEVEVNLLYVFNMLRNCFSFTDTNNPLRATVMLMWPLMTITINNNNHQLVQNKGENLYEPFKY